MTVRNAKIGELRPECTVYIYALTEPDTGAIRYIGKSTDPMRRWRDHMWRCNCERDSHTKRWLRTLKAKGQMPGLLTVEETDEAHWEERERYWIAYYREQGAELTNTAPGGNGCNPCPPELEEQRRRKISQARKGMKFPEIHRRHLSERKREYFSTVENTYNLSRYWAALSDEQVIEVWRLANEGGLSNRALAERYGIPASSVSEIKHRKRYKHALAGLDDQGL